MRPLTDEDSALLEKYKAEIASFRKFCIESGGDVAFQESDFRDLSMGFFIALGVTGDGGPDIAEPFYDVGRLASLTRYTFEYWEGETL